MADGIQRFASGKVLCKTIFPRTSPQNLAWCFWLKCRLGKLGKNLFSTSLYKFGCLVTSSPIQPSYTEYQWASYGIWSHLVGWSGTAGGVVDWVEFWGYVTVSWRFLNQSNHSVPISLIRQTMWHKFGTVTNSSVQTKNQTRTKQERENNINSTSYPTNITI